MSENVYEFADRETIAEEARRWLIRLDGNTPLYADEAVALREWIARSPAHRKELRRIVRFWDRGDILTELAIPLQGVGERRRNLLSVTRLAAAFSLLLAVAVATWFMQSADRDGNGIYGTVVGQQQAVELTDGSTLQLNTDSQVQVDYNEVRRRIRLLRGEAYFKVARDPDRPFEVLAGNGLVRAVGTAFSVYLRDMEVKVTVTEGQVDVATVDTTAHVDGGENDTAATEPAPKKLGTLKSGQKATFSNNINEITEVTDAELQRLQSWRQGMLVFNGEPLSDVIREVNRYTPMTIEITDPALNSVKVGGRFKVGEFETMFDVLEQSFGIEVARLSDQHIQLRAAREIDH